MLFLRLRTNSPLIGHSIIIVDPTILSLLRIISSREIILNVSQIIYFEFSKWLHIVLKIKSQLRTDSFLLFRFLLIAALEELLLHGTLHHTILF